MIHFWTEKSVLENLKHTDLEVQFQSTDYMLVVRICKNFEQNKPCL